MPTYSFCVRKGKYRLSLSTTDKDIVIRQFEKWVADASAYAREHKARECKNIITQQIQKEEAITQRNIDEQLSKLTENIPHENEKEETYIQSNNVSESVQPVKVCTENEQKKDLDMLYTSTAEEENKNTTINEQTKKEGVFGDILENSMNNMTKNMSLKQSPSINKDNAFLNFITNRKIEKKIDYLLLTAYYFSQYEQRPRFTIKQLNTKLMQNIAVIIDHSILQEAINRGLIECLPDLTGIVGASEYRLTAYGEKVLFDE